MEKHAFKTPYQVIFGQVPDLSHLHSYGCKTYPLIKHLPRKQKLAERAHIGNLVGYEARNIFRIWVPASER